MSNNTFPFLNADWSPDLAVETWEIPPHEREDLIRLEGSTIPIMGRHFYRVPDGHLLKVGGEEDEARVTVLARQVLESKKGSGGGTGKRALVHIPKIHDFVLIPKINGTAILLDYIEGVPLSKVWMDLSASQQESIKNQLCDVLLTIRGHSFSYAAGRPGRRPYVLLGAVGNSKFEFCSDVEAWNESRMKMVRGNVADGRAATLCEQQKKLSLPTERSVLTHGDLSDRNIMVNPNTFDIVGIIDWETANIAPSYFEYVAARLSSGHLPDWKRELLDVLERVLERECADKTSAENELKRWKGLVDVERSAQDLDDCPWTFEPEDTRATPAASGG